MLGIKDQFLPKIVGTAITLSAGCDPEVAKNSDRIKQEVAREEDRSRPYFASRMQIYSCCTFQIILFLLDLLFDSAVCYRSNAAPRFGQVVCH